MFIYLCLFINDTCLWEDTFFLLIFSCRQDFEEENLPSLYESKVLSSYSFSFYRETLGKVPGTVTTLPSGRYLVAPPLHTKTMGRALSVTLGFSGRAVYAVSSLHFCLVRAEWVCIFNNILMQSSAFKKKKNWCQAWWCSPGIPAIQEAEAGGFQVQCCPWLQTSEVTQATLRICLKIRSQKIRAQGVTIMRESPAASWRAG